MERQANVTLNDRLSLLRGVCSVVGTLPHEDRTRVFGEIFSISLKGLEKSSLLAQQATPPLQPDVLLRIAEEIRILSTWIVGLTGNHSIDTDRMESGCCTSSEYSSESMLDQHVIEYVRKGWPYVSYYARNFGGIEVRRVVLLVCWG